MECLSPSLPPSLHLCLEVPGRQGEHVCMHYNVELSLNIYCFSLLCLFVFVADETVINELDEMRCTLAGMCVCVMCGMFDILFHMRRYVMCVCHVCVCVCVCVRVFYVCVIECIYIIRHARTNTHAYIHLHSLTSKRKHPHTRTLQHPHTRARTHTHEHTYTHSTTHTPTWQDTNR